MSTGSTRLSSPWKNKTYFHFCRPSTKIVRIEKISFVAYGRFMQTRSHICMVQLLSVTFQECNLTMPYLGETGRVCANHSLSGDLSASLQHQSLVSMSIPIFLSPNSRQRLLPERRYVAKSAINSMPHLSPPPPL